MLDTQINIRTLHDFKLLSTRLSDNFEGFYKEIFNETGIELSNICRSHLQQVLAKTLFDVKYEVLRNHFDKFPRKKQREIFSHPFCFNKKHDFNKNEYELNTLAINYVSKMQDSNASLSQQFSVWHSYAIRHDQYDNPEFRDGKDKAYLRVKVQRNKMSVELSEIDHYQHKDDELDKSIFDDYYNTNKIHGTFGYIRHINHKLSNEVLDLISTIISSKYVYHVFCLNVKNEYLQNILKGFGFDSSRASDDQEETFNYNFYK